MTFHDFLKIGSKKNKEKNLAQLSQKIRWAYKSI